jgi:predicted nucleotide-binding protein
LLNETGKALAERYAIRMDSATDLLSFEKRRALTVRMEEDKHIHNWELSKFLKHFAYLAKRRYFSKEHFTEAADTYGIDLSTLNMILDNLSYSNNTLQTKTEGGVVLYRMVGRARDKYEASLKQPAPSPQPERRDKPTGRDKDAQEAPTPAASAGKRANAPRNPQELRALVEEVLVHFNNRRRAAELATVGAYLDAHYDCGFWGCVLAEAEQPYVKVKELFSREEVESEHKRQIEDVRARGLLVHHFMANSKTIGQNPSPEEFANNLWRSVSATSGEGVPGMPDPNRVFIIHGRNINAYHEMVKFLRALRLHPLSFNEASAKCGTHAAVLEIVRYGMAQAQGVVALFTPDEWAVLRPALAPKRRRGDEYQRWQARPNVIFEAGLAMGIAENRAVLVTLGPDVRLFSDVGGIHTVRLDNGHESRNLLRDKLRTAGCSPDMQTGDHLHIEQAGNFRTCVRFPKEKAPVDPFAKPTRTVKKGARKK